MPEKIIVQAAAVPAELEQNKRLLSLWKEIKQRGDALKAAASVR